jgi:TonB family protein
MDALLFSNLLAHAFQAALLTASAAALARVLRGQHPQLTLAIWQAVLAAIAVLPLVQPWIPTEAQLTFVTIEQTLSTGPDTLAAEPGFVLAGLLLPALLVVIVGGIAVRFAWLTAGLWHLQRLQACAPLVESWPEAIRAAVLESGTDAVFRRSGLSAPVSFGLTRGVVLLPRNFAALDTHSQYLVALHELLHVRRRDALQCLVEECLVSIFWFYPWVWWIRGRIRLAREQVVDRATARAKPARDAYVRTLLGFAGHHPRPLPTASGMWGANELRTRIDALYKEVTMSRSRLLVSAAAAILALGGVSVLGASVFPLYSAPLPAPAGSHPAKVTLVKADAPVAQQDEEVVRIGGDVKPPKKIKHVSPVYPEDAREAGIEGVVIVEAVINKEGKVARAWVLRSVPELDQAALDAVLQWEFEPTYVKGKPVSVEMTITINFTLAK